MLGATVGALQPTSAGADDPVPPTIQAVYAEPSNLAWDGGLVTVYASLDSPAGIANASFGIYLANGGTAYATMTESSPGSNLWSGGVVLGPNYEVYGVNHNVEISVMGNDGGYTQEFVTSLTQDGQPQFDQAPYVQVDSVDPTSLSSAGGQVLIRASATDDRAVSEVYATVTGPAGSSVVYMSPYSGDQWEGTLDVPANTSHDSGVSYTVQATALDDIGQYSTADGPSIYVAPVENQPPTVANPSVTPTSLPATGGDVTIRADVTDADGSVQDVTAFVLAPEGGFTPVPMTQASVGAPYEGIWTAPANTGEPVAEYAVLITAIDNEGAPGEADAGSVTVDGTPPFDEAPDVFDPSVTPTSLPAAGGQITIEASATDDRAISEVYAVITSPAGSAVVPMGGISSSRYQAVYTVPANGTSSPVVYSVEVSALDDIGQQDIEDAGTVTVAVGADTPPVLSVLSVTPRSLSAAGGSVSIRAKATDDNAIAKVVAAITRPNGSIAKIVLARVRTSSFYKGAYQLPANPKFTPVSYGVAVTARDRSNQTDTEDACDVSAPARRAAAAHR